MNKIVDAQVSSIFRTHASINAFSGSWAGMQPIIKHEIQLGVIENKIIQEFVNAGLTSKGASEDKKAKLGNMITKSLIIAGSVYDYGSDKENNELMEKVDITASSFAHLSELEKATLANEIVAAATDSIADMGTDYIIAQTDIDELKTFVSSYKVYIPKPKAVITDAAVARKNIKKLVKEGLSVLKKVDKLMNNFLNTDFYKSYFSARKIIYASTANKIYTLEVACHIIKKICIHLFKIGETVTIENDGTVSLQVGLAFNAKSTVLVWYTVAAGERVTVKPDLMGNLDFKYVMVKNADLYVKGHLVFTINKSK